MKKKTFIFIMFIILLCMVFSACNKAKYTVFFETNGGTKVDAVATDGKSDIQLPSPKRTGYEFEGWYYDNNTFRKPFTKNSLKLSPIKSNLTVYAKWKKKLVSTEGLTYKMENDAFTVTGYNGSSKDIIIAGEHNGYPIHKIADEVFKDNNKIKSVIIDKAIQEIGNAVFKGCVALEEITLPFVGKSRKATGSQGVLGYIFGSSETFSLYPLLTVSQQYNSDSSLFYFVPSSLKKVIITDADSLSYGAFSNLTNLTEVTLNEGIIILSTKSFFNCKKLESIYIPKSVEIIGRDSFIDCNSLIIYCGIDNMPEGWMNNWKDQDTNAYWGVNRIDTGKEGSIHFLITEDDSIAITNCKSQEETVTIPSSIHSMPVKAIYAYAFNDLGKMKTLTLPQSLTEIQPLSINECNKLEELTLPFIGGEKSQINNSYMGYIFGALAYTSNKDYVPANIKKLKISSGNIENNAFFDCENLESVELPNNLNKIGESAFQNCKKLQTIEIPETTTSIGKNAFSNCINLIEISIPDSVNNIGDYAFNNCISLANVELPNKLKSINEYVFNACRSLNTINIPSAVTSIGERAFSGCLALQSLNLPSALTRIESHAFYGCESFVSIIIPENVIYIGDWAYQGCSSMIYIFIPKEVITVGAGAFVDCENLTIYCEVNSQPSGYSEQWNGGRPCLWNSSL